MSIKIAFMTFRKKQEKADSPASMHGHDDSSCRVAHPSYTNFNVCHALSHGNCATIRQSQDVAKKSKSERHRQVTMLLKISMSKQSEDLVRETANAPEPPRMQYAPRLICTYRERIEGKLKTANTKFCWCVLSDLCMRQFLHYSRCLVSVTKLKRKFDSLKQN